ncbi:MAG: hypothetical protein WAM28_07295 [Chlamydiales bacterium]
MDSNFTISARSQLGIIQDDVRALNSKNRFLNHTIYATLATTLALAIIGTLAACSIGQLSAISNAWYYWEAAAVVSLCIPGVLYRIKNEKQLQESTLRATERMRLRATERMRLRATERMRGRLLVLLSRARKNIKEKKLNKATERMRGRLPVLLSRARKNIKENKAKESMRNLLREKLDKVHLPEKARQEKINNMSFEDIASGKADAIIEESLKHFETFKSREMLWNLAFFTFSGNKPRMLEYIWDYNPILVHVLLDSRFTPAEIILVFQRCYEGWKELATSRIKEEQRENTKEIENEEERDYRRAYSQSDTEITVLHVGGILYLQGFLQGKYPGYQLENGGYGLQVTPLENATYDNLKKDRKELLETARVLDYGDRAAKYHDKTALLVAKIKSKYLDRAPNGYEAGLRVDFREMLKEVRILDMRDEVGYYQLKGNQGIDGTKVRTIFSDHPALVRRILANEEDLSLYWTQDPGKDYDVA